ncbi:hypothetical protein PV08_03078 [Exophiala spinifera]|uniref:Uncharacterized protein n=1 Tax=Exophiala spinifera TaxID=91928 RepID=A0A0D2C5B6_9EURO|nr:uncharacterized protein PV08_03078 [Exophiala spinifera]KIW18789.1 hypothetical protein PV08_03078 [Exophiala spinifera]
MDYFERGEKIGDSSNRYVHTCRRCLQVFPKGRMENMTKHLTKECPDMSLKERLQVILRLNDLARSDVDQSIYPLVPGRGGNEVEEDSNSFNLSRASAPELHTASQQSALEVLAEASRQLYNPLQQQGFQPPAASHRMDNPVQQQDFQPPAASHRMDNPLQAQGFQTPAASHRMDNTLQQQGFRPPAASLHVDNILQQQGFDHLQPQAQSAYAEAHPGPSSESHGPPQIHPGPFDSHSNDFQDSNNIHDAFGRLISTNTQISDEVFTNLPATALSHGYDSFPGSHETSLPPLLPDAGPPDAAPEWNSLPTTTALAENILPASRNNEAIEPIEHSSAAPEPIAFDSDDQTTPVIPKTAAPKKAKKGRRPGRSKFAPDAKLQVAMVRKIGACSRCRALRKPCEPVDPTNPRGVCKLCTNMKNPRTWKNVCIRPRLWEILEAYFARPHVHAVNREQTGITWLKFGGLVRVAHFEGKNVELGARYRRSQLSSDGDLSELSIAQQDGAVVINVEPKDDRVERYLKAIGEDVIAREKCPVIKATLQVAHSIQREQLANPSTDKEDGLLSDIIELWTATSLMVDPDLKADFTIVSGRSEPLHEVSESQNGSTYAAMVNQFHAVLENRTSLLCKPTMRRFEECCGHPKKPKTFQVFLTAFIMLNCAERMCWLFRRWESGVSVSAPWSLVRTASSYADQGAFFLESVSVLLSPQALKPDLKVSEQTGLVVAVKSGDPNLLTWLDNARFTADFGKRPNNEQPDFNDCRSMDGTLSGQLLEI